MAELTNPIMQTLVAARCGLVVYQVGDDLFTLSTKVEGDPFRFEQHVFGGTLSGRPLPDRLRLSQIRSELHSDCLKLDLVFFFLSSLDSSLSLDLRFSIAQYLDDLLAHGHMFSLAREVLISESFKSEGDSVLHSNFESLQRYSQLIEWIESHQQSLSRFWLAWGRLPQHVDFSKIEYGLDSLRDALLANGFIARFVIAMSKNDKRELERAMEAFSQASEAHLEFPNVTYTLGIILGLLNAPAKIVNTSQIAASSFDAAAEAAEMMFAQGSALGRLRRPEEAISVYDELKRRFAGSESPVIKVQIAKAMFNKGVALEGLGLLSEAINNYDELLITFAASKSLVIYEHTANAMFNKGSALGLLGRFEDSIIAYEELIDSFVGVAAHAAKKPTAMALLNKGIALGQLGKREEEIETYDRLVALFSMSQDAAVHVFVATALNYKAIALSQLGRHEEEMEVYDEIIDRFKFSENLAVKTQFDKAESNRQRTVSKGRLTRDGATSHNSWRSNEIN